MQMRKSNVLRKMRNGEVISCFKLNLACSRAVEIAGASGFDCLWTDTEHIGNDWSVVEKQILAAKTQNVDIVARVARGSYSDHVKPLEMDATGIMVPHVMDIDDAKRVVRMTRFHPIGRRPTDRGNADGSYCRLSMMEYITQANQERFVIVQIEDPEALDDLDAIAALDGIDMLFFGPGDFSHSVGVPGQINHPIVVEARKRVAKACRNHGKYAATVGGLDKLDELIEMGYKFISIGADVVGLVDYCDGLMEGFHSRVGGRSPAVSD